MKAAYTMLVNDVRLFERFKSPQKDKFICRNVWAGYSTLAPHFGQRFCPNLRSLAPMLTSSLALLGSQDQK